MAELQSQLEVSFPLLASVQPASMPTFRCCVRSKLWLAACMRVAAQVSQFCISQWASSACVTPCLG